MNKNKIIGEPKRGRTYAVKNNKKYVFFFHYNKPESKKAGRNKLTIHFRGKCHLVDKIVCNVGVFSYNNKKQPHCVLKGKCKELVLVKEFDLISESYDPKIEITGILN